MQNNIGFFYLGPDQYIMYVRDSRGCIDRDTIIIDQPDSIYIDTTIFTHVTCHGANDGAIQSINAYGGFQPYFFVRLPDGTSETQAKDIVRFLQQLGVFRSNKHGRLSIQRSL